MTPEDIYKTRRGWFNKPRDIAIYLVRTLRGEPLNRIPEIFCLKGYSTVSSVIQRVGVLRKKDKRIRQDLDALIKDLTITE